MALTFLPAASPGYNDCFVCVINGGKFCSENTIAFRGSTVSFYCSSNAKTGECSTTLITTMTGCEEKTTSITIKDTAPSTKACNSTT